MRARDAVKTGVIRGLLAAFTNELIAKGSTSGELSDDDVLALIRRAVKQRKDSIEQYTAGGRKDLADIEVAELGLLEKYLPAMMSRDDIRKFVEGKSSASSGTNGTGGAIDKAKIGQFIGSIMKDLKGKADGADVKAVVEEMVK